MTDLELEVGYMDRRVSIKSGTFAGASGRVVGYDLTYWGGKRIVKVELDDSTRALVWLIDKAMPCYIHELELLDDEPVGNKVDQLPLPG